MKTDYWLVCFTILASVFLVSCQSESVEKEDRLIIDFAAIDDVFPQAQGINIYKTCSKGKDFSNKNLEILLRGWNEVMEELKNPSVRSSLFKKNRSEVLIWNETWTDNDTRNEFEAMWQELYDERWSDKCKYSYKWISHFHKYLHKEEIRVLPLKYVHRNSSN